MFKKILMITSLMANTNLGYSAGDLENFVEREGVSCAQLCRNDLMEVKPMFDKIVTYLNQENIEHKVIEHEAETESAKIIEILSRELGEEITLSKAAKSLLILSSSQSQDSYNLVVLPGDETIDFKLLAQILGIKKVKLAPLDKIEEVTTCKVGTVPPFPLFPNPNIPFMVDHSLVSKNRGGYIFLTPGRPDRSILLKIEDYIRIVSPRLVNVIKIR